MGKKEDIRQKYDELHPHAKEGGHWSNIKVTAGTIKKVSEMYPYSSVIEIAAELGFGYEHVNKILMAMRKEGIVLKKRETQAEMINRAIKDYKGTLK